MMSTLPEALPYSYFLRTFPQHGSNACLLTLARDGDCSLEDESMALLARSEVSSVKDLRCAWRHSAGKDTGAFLARLTRSNGRRTG